MGTLADRRQVDSTGGDLPDQAGVLERGRACSSAAGYATDSGEGAILSTGAESLPPRSLAALSAMRAGGLLNSSVFTLRR